MSARLNWVERLLLALLLFFDMTYVSAALPAKPTLSIQAQEDMLILNQEISKYWKELAPKSFLASVVDQESNWKSTAALRTKREFGCGYGQFTMAYNANGSVRFDALEETKRLDPSLANWNWKDCYNATYQFRGLVLKMRNNERNCSAVMDGNRNIKACSGAAYNGGFGSITKRIRLCRMTPGCEPDEWFNHLERQCAQDNTKAVGYGESFCEINAKYPGRVEARQGKFLPYYPGDKLLSEDTKKEVK